MTARSRTVWTFVVTGVALFMAQLDNLVVTTALPVIRADLHASLSSLEWTVNAYTLTFAVLLLPGASLGERFGRRRMLGDDRDGAALDRLPGERHAIGALALERDEQVSGLDPARIVRNASHWLR